MTSVKSYFNHAIRVAEKQITDSYTARLREHADAYSWPEEIVNQIRMDYDENTHSIKYPEHLEDAILTLEYGTSSVPPSPALRTFTLGIIN